MKTPLLLIGALSLAGYASASPTIYGANTHP